MTALPPGPFGLILADPPWCMTSLRVHQLLTWLPLFADHRASRVLRVAGIGETRVLGNLTERERGVLADLLR